MTKEKILRNTVILLVTALSFICASLYLGPPNIIIGVVVFLIGLFILNKDFTGTPLFITIKIMSLTLFIAVMPFIANLNIYTGLVINFVSIFVMLYLLVYRLKKSIYFPFLIGYTLFLCVQAHGHYFKMRLLALTIIGIVAILIQLALNKKNSRKIIVANFEGMINSLYALADNILKQEGKEKTIEDFDNYNIAWANQIFETRNNTFYLKRKEDISLNLISSLEKLKKELLEIDSIDSCDKNLLEDIKKSLKAILSYYKKDIDKEIFKSQLKNINQHHIHGNSNDLLKYELEESIRLLRNLIIDFMEFKKCDNDRLYYEKRVKETVVFGEILRSHFTKDSVRFTFAFRTALVISVTYFLIEFFKVPHGSWIIYTIASVSQPYNDSLKNRGIDRVIGTTKGAIYFLILFTIFRGNIERYIILLIATYLNSFMTSYNRQITTITILILGLANMSIPDPALLSFDRIYLIIIGVIITLTAGKFILPYHIARETKVLINSYYDISVEILDKLMSITKFKDNRLEIQNSILLSKCIERKIKINNRALDNKILHDFINEERYLFIKIQSIINRVEYDDLSLMENREERLKSLNKIRDFMNEYYKENGFIYSDVIPDYIKEYFDNANKTSEKLIYKDIFEVLVSIRTCEQLKNKLLKV